LHFIEDAERVAKVLKYDLGRVKEYQLNQINKLKEDRMTTIHHYQVQKKQHKSWHEKHL
jgi:hypothetical protein